MNDFRTEYRKDSETLALLRQLLKTADGMPAPYADARVKDGRVQPSPVGHALSGHVAAGGRLLDELRDGGRAKSRFRRFDDAAEALRQLLNSPAGQRELKFIQDHADTGRQVRANVTPLFDVECSTRARGRRSFSADQLRAAGQFQISCFAKIAVRSRNGVAHLHVQTLYPEVADVVIDALILRFPDPARR